ncbi:hypothetical protein SCRM01_237 [Synechococcus phage S-CRM01]|uniref:hypothetical protein n=1 Tax=Synechococcus phage S-CRM01 TaxID=1026955 RepID=UPI000209E43E|nr:hypothetical protein SCRM01_237 [Synechococcus phage S-CRM01]AEC53183.1 hypothetical protein SCRM01_237 [Synechococcus phage S-CRM01]
MIYNEQTWCKILVLQEIQARRLAEKKLWCERGWDYSESQLIKDLNQVEESINQGIPFHADVDIHEMLAFVQQHARIPLEFFQESLQYTV